MSKPTKITQNNKNIEKIVFANGLIFLNIKHWYLYMLAHSIYNKCNLNMY